MTTQDRTTSIDAARELNASDPLTARVELMDSTGRTVKTLVTVETVADIFPAAEAWADRHGFSDYAANEWWPA